MPIKGAHLLASAVVLLLAASAQTQTFTTIYNFTGAADGNSPDGFVIQDASGNLYGETYYGGSSSLGVVFEVSGSGTETVLHNFAGGTSDGAYPFQGMARDSNGNLYGDTQAGGAYDHGVVFEIDTAGTETVLYSFGSGNPDGAEPFQGVIMDKAENIYGTTYYGGSYGGGVIWKLSKDGTETILHNFAGSEGSYPEYGHLILDKKGSLYGLTSEGGTSNDGVLYKLSKNGKLTVLHSFGATGYDGTGPTGTVAMDGAGNLYGTTYDGTVWEVAKNGTETVLHSFNGADGANPRAGVTLDSHGNIFGTTWSGGANNMGVVYELSPNGKLTVLHSFAGVDGANPWGELLRTAKGELYGTTYGGGAYGNGTVWSYVP